MQLKLKLKLKKIVKDAKILTKNQFSCIRALLEMLFLNDLLPKKKNKIFLFFCHFH